MKFGKAKRLLAILLAVVMLSAFVPSFAMANVSYDVLSAGENYTAILEAALRLFDSGIVYLTVAENAGNANARAAAALGVVQRTLRENGYHSIAEYTDSTPHDFPVTVVRPISGGVSFELILSHPQTGVPEGLRVDPVQRFISIAANPNEMIVEGARTFLSSSPGDDPIIVDYDSFFPDISRIAGNANQQLRTRLGTLAQNLSTTFVRSNNQWNIELAGTVANAPPFRHTVDNFTINTSTAHLSPDVLARDAEAFVMDVNGGSIPLNYANYRLARDDQARAVAVEAAIKTLLENAPSTIFGAPANIVMGTAFASNSPSIGPAAPPVVINGETGLYEISFSVGGRIRVVEVTARPDPAAFVTQIGRAHV